MSLEVALSFLLYAFVSGITPGPANLCSLSVAMKTGKSVAIKQWYGLFTGYTIVALASVFIVYFISSAFESFIEVFSFIGAIYIAYLAISLLLQAIKPYDEIRNNRATDHKRHLKLFVMQALAALLLVRRFQNKGLRVAMVCVIIMSPGCICSVLRGNPSGWAFALVCAFLAWYRSENRFLRVIAAVALGMATALKIAPCLFGVLYLSDVFRKPRRIPVLEILLAGSAAALLVFFPFFFWGGTDSIAQWMANARANAAFYSVRWPIWGFVGFANHFLDSSELVLPSAVWFAAATHIFSGVLVVVSLLARRTYLKLLFIGSALAFSTHHDYGGAYLLPAFIAWLDASETVQGAPEAVQGGDSGLGLLLEAVAWTVVVTPLQVPNPCRPGTMNALLQNEFLFVLLTSAFVRLIAERRLSGFCNRFK